MVHALIFAGGTGLRMNAKSKPKQFLELHGKWDDDVASNYESMNTKDLI